MLMDVEKLQAESGVSKYTWRSWIKQQRIASVKLGRRIFVTRETYEKFIRASTRPARPEAVGR